MRRIKQTSLYRLNQILDAEYVLSLLGARGIQHAGHEIKATCPIHASDNQRNLTVRLKDNVCMCQSKECSVYKGMNLLWLWSLKFDVSVENAGLYWSRKMGFTLEFESSIPRKRRWMPIAESVLKTAS